MKYSNEYNYRSVDDTIDTLIKKINDVQMVKLKHHIAK